MMEEHSDMANVDTISMVSDLGSDEDIQEARRAKRKRWKWLASRLWPKMLYYIVKDPKRTAMLYGGFNAVFIGIGELISMFVWLLTWPGFIVFNLVCLYLLVYNVARAIVYPGFVPNVRRSLERDISKEVKRNVVHHVRLFDRLFQLLTTVYIQQPRYIPIGKLKSDIMGILDSIIRSRNNTIQPTVETLTNMKEASGTLLDYGGEDFLRSMELLCKLEELFQGKFMVPMLSALEQNGYSGMTQFLQVPFTNASFDINVLLAGDLAKELIVNDSILSAQIMDNEDLFSYLEHHPDELFDRIVLLLKHVATLSSCLVEARPGSVTFVSLPEQEHDDEKDETSLDEQEMQEIEDVKIKMKQQQQQAEGSETTATTTTTEEPTSEEIDDDDDDGHTKNESSLIGTVKRSYHDFWRAREPMKSLCTIDFMRADLQTRLKGKQLWLKMTDGTKLDAMLIPAKLDKFQHDKRTILMCNPNCGIYEFAWFQCHWASFYTKLGFNVLLYNYRGYSRSEGWPSPHKLRTDGESIIKYLTDVEGVKKGWVGVHAESIGGVVACHLARHAENLGISYVVADRTFCDLPTTANAMLGNWAGNALRVIGWQADNVEGFLASPDSVYRVCTCDPSDEIIANVASLKCGIARTLVHTACSDEGKRFSLLSEEKRRLLELSKRRIGSEDATIWLIDSMLFESFGNACVTLIEAQRHHMIEDPMIFTFVREIIKVIWYTDGKCGQCLGVPMSEYYAKWKEIHENPTKQQLQQQRDTDMKAIADRTSPLKDWTYCFLVWGKHAPELDAILEPPPHGQMKQSIFALGGERGVCGPYHQLPLEKVLSMLANVLETSKDKWEDAGLYEPMQTICDMFGRINQHATRKRVGKTPIVEPDTIEEADLESNVSTSTSSSNVHLLPLSCGHNGRMNDKEQKCLLEHVRNAGWL